MRTKLGGVTRSGGFTLIELMIVIAIIAILADILIPNFVRARSQGQLVTCESNEKNVATALEMYAADTTGTYPPGLALLTPNYIKVIPTCPAAGTDTYTPDYVSVNTGTGALENGFTFYCSGQFHAILNLQPNFPQYGQGGLLLGP